MCFKKSLSYRQQLPYDFQMKFREERTIVCAGEVIHNWIFEMCTNHRNLNFLRIQIKIIFREYLIIKIIWKLKEWRGLSYKNYIKQNLFIYLLDKYSITTHNVKMYPRRYIRKILIVHEITGMCIASLFGSSRSTFTILPIIKLFNKHTYVTFNLLVLLPSVLFSETMFFVALISNRTIDWYTLQCKKKMWWNNHCNILVFNNIFYNIVCNIYL